MLQLDRSFRENQTILGVAGCCCCRLCPDSEQVAACDQQISTRGTRYSTQAGYRQMQKKEVAVDDVSKVSATADQEASCCSR